MRLSRQAAIPCPGQTRTRHPSWAVLAKMQLVTEQTKSRDHLPRSQSTFPLQDRTVSTLCFGALWSPLCCHGESMWVWLPFQESSTYKPHPPSFADPCCTILLVCKPPNAPELLCHEESTSPKEAPGLCPAAGLQAHRVSARGSDSHVTRAGGLRAGTAPPRKGWGWRLNLITV